MPVEIRELSPAKLNLFLKIVSKRTDGYHNLRSGVTLINVFDEVVAFEDSKFNVKYIGEFSPKNHKFQDCIIEKIFSKLNLAKPNYSFIIKKNIPIMSGLGSASSNAAAVLRILQKLNYKHLEFKTFSKIGADVPFFINNHDALVRGTGNIINKKNFPKYFFLIAKPALNCSTKNMYNHIQLENLNFNLDLDNSEINEYDNGNDFEVILENKFIEISHLLKFMRNLPKVIFSRLTGSGSCIFSAFESKKDADSSLAIFKDQFPLLWSRVVENNFIHN